MELGEPAGEDIYEAAWARWGDGASGRTAPLRALGVGAAKTGTHSLAAVLRGAVDAQHEIGATRAPELALSYRAGGIDQAELLWRVAQIEAETGAEVSVSQINGFLIEEMVQLHPRALYLMTVRDAGSWLKSMINAILVGRRDPTSVWNRFRDLRFDVRRHPFEPGDEPLKRRGLHSLEAYLSDWSGHVLRVVAAVPPGRLMVLPTFAIAREIPRLAEALGVAPDRLHPEHSHSNAKRYVDSPLDELDPRWLDQGLKAHSDRLWAGAKERLAGVERDRLEEAIFA